MSVNFFIKLQFIYFALFQCRNQHPRRKDPQAREDLQKVHPKTHRTPKHPKDPRRVQKEPRNASAQLPDVAEAI